MPLDQEWVCGLDYFAAQGAVDITARVTYPPNPSKSSFVGWIELPANSAAEYKIYYRDPDGYRHPVGKVFLTQS
jgi:hypothetical protein